MRGRFSVARYAFPAVDIDLVAAHVYHRLYRDRHVPLQPHADASLAVVRYGRIFVKMSPHAVSYHISHNRESVFFGMLLNLRSDISERASDTYSFYPFEKTFSRNVDKLFLFGAYMPYV